MPIVRFLAARREARARIQRDAGDLILWLGEGAYAEARSRGRECRGRADQAGYRHWSGVAVEIARRTDYPIGERVADRYAAEREGRTRPARPVAPKREIVDGLVDIATAIADLSHARADATRLHNARARVLIIVEMAGSSPELVEAGRALCRALDDLDADETGCLAALVCGAYPERALAAGKALQRLKDALSLAAGVPARM